MNTEIDQNSLFVTGNHAPQAAPELPAVVAGSSRPRRISGRNRLRLGIAALIVVAGIGEAIGQADRDEQGEIVNAGSVVADELRVGDCLDVPEASEFTSVHAVPCAEPHDAELFHVFELAGDEYPTPLELEAALVANCLPAFESYVGRSFEEAVDLDIDAFFPLERAWNMGDRSASCLLVQA